MSRIWKLDFRLWTEAKDSPQPIRDNLAHVSGSERINPLDRQGRSTDVDYYAWTLRLPTLWGVSLVRQPTRMHSAETDITEAPRNRNNHISQTRQGV